MNKATCTGSTDSPIRSKVPDLSRVPLAAVPLIQHVWRVLPPDLADPKPPVDFASAI